jgi:oligoribonuclease (3'-5' exoribonuclease)
MSKITYEQKMRLLESYIAVPRGVHDVEVLKAIKMDVIKGASKTPPRKSPKEEDNELYNQCMGVYREFLNKRNSHLDMTGRKAKDNSEAMRNIINYIHNFAKSNQRPHDDASVLKGIQFMFEHWDRLNDFHRNRIKLPDIYENIEEILPMIRNGYDKKTSAKSNLEQFEQSLKRG